MNVSARLLLKVAESPVIVRADFSDAEWKQLHSYLKYSDEVSEAPLLKNGFSIKTVLKLGAKASGDESSIPPMNDVRLLLHLLRPLILESEPASFLRTRKLLHRRLDNAIVRDMLDAQLKRFNGTRAQSLVRIELGDTPLNSEKLLTTWLNAHEFHRDEDKQREIDALDAAFPAKASRAIWIGLLMHKCQAISDLAGIAACLTGRTGELLAEGPNPF